jgi:hypothetical protein
MGQLNQVHLAASLQQSTLDSAREQSGMHSQQESDGANKQVRCVYNSNHISNSSTVKQYGRHGGGSRVTGAAAGAAHCAVHTVLAA